MFRRSPHRVAYTINWGLVFLVLCAVVGWIGIVLLGVLGIARMLP